MALRNENIVLYLRIAKKYAADLSDEKERVKAFKWIRLIQKTTDDCEIKTKMHVMHLLLICLQRKRLVGPFQRPPKEDKALTDYGWAFQPVDIGRLILTTEHRETGQVPIQVDFSGDLCEFVASQEIPKFGKHFYYAYSPEPFYNWDRLEPKILPKGTLTKTAPKSPEASSLAEAVENLVRDKRAQLVATLEEQSRKTEQGKSFTDAVMIDPGSGQLKTTLTTEVPGSKDIDTDLLQAAIKIGAVKPKELASPINISGRDSIGSPHIETVEIRKGPTSAKKIRKVKNVRDKSQRTLIGQALEAIEEAPEDQTSIKRATHPLSKTTDISKSIYEDAAGSSYDNYATADGESLYQTAADTFGGRSKVIFPVSSTFVDSSPSESPDGSESFKSKMFPTDESSIPFSLKRKNLRKMRPPYRQRPETYSLDESSEIGDRPIVPISVFSTSHVDVDESDDGLEITESEVGESSKRKDSSLLGRTLLESPAMHLDKLFNEPVFRDNAAGFVCKKTIVDDGRGSPIVSEDCRVYPKDKGKKPTTPDKSKSKFDSPFTPIYGVSLAYIDFDEGDEWGTTSDEEAEDTEGEIGEPIEQRKSPPTVRRSATPKRRALPRRRRRLFPESPTMEFDAAFENISPRRAGVICMKKITSEGHGPPVVQEECRIIPLDKTASSSQKLKTPSSKSSHENEEESETTDQDMEEDEEDSEEHEEEDDDKESESVTETAEEIEDDKEDWDTFEDENDSETEDQGILVCEQNAANDRVDLECFLVPSSQLENILPNAFDLTQSMNLDQFFKDKSIVCEEKGTSDGGVEEICRVVPSPGGNEEASARRTPTATPRKSAISLLADTMPSCPSRKGSFFGKDSPHVDVVMCRRQIFDDGGGSPAVQGICHSVPASKLKTMNTGSFLEKILPDTSHLSDTTKSMNLNEFFKEKSILCEEKRTSDGNVQQKCRIIPSPRAGSTPTRKAPSPPQRRDSSRISNLTDTTPSYPSRRRKFLSDSPDGSDRTQPTIRDEFFGSDSRDGDDLLLCHQQITNDKAGSSSVQSQCHSVPASQLQNISAGSFLGKIFPDISNVSNTTKSMKLDDFFKEKSIVCEENVADDGKTDKECRVVPTTSDRKTDRSATSLLANTTPSYPSRRKRIFLSPNSPDLTRTLHLDEFFEDDTKLPDEFESDEEQSTVIDDIADLDEPLTSTRIESRPVPHRISTRPNLSPLREDDDEGAWGYEEAADEQNKDLSLQGPQPVPGFPGFPGFYRYPPGQLPPDDSANRILDRLIDYYSRPNPYRALLELESLSPERLQEARRARKEKANKPPWAPPRPSTPYNRAPPPEDPDDSYIDVGKALEKGRRIPTGSPRLLRSAPSTPVRRTQPQRPHTVSRDRDLSLGPANISREMSDIYGRDEEEGQQHFGSPAPVLMKRRTLFPVSPGNENMESSFPDEFFIILPEPSGVMMNRQRLEAIPEEDELSEEEEENLAVKAPPRRIRPLVDEETGLPLREIGDKRRLWPIEEGVVPNWESPKTPWRQRLLRTLSTPPPPLRQPMQKPKRRFSLPNVPRPTRTSPQILSFSTNRSPGFYITTPPRTDSLSTPPRASPVPLSRPDTPALPSRSATPASRSQQFYITTPRREQSSQSALPDDQTTSNQAVSLATPQSSEALPQNELYMVIPSTSAQSQPSPRREPMDEILAQFGGFHPITSQDERISGGNESTGIQFSIEYNDCSQPIPPPVPQRQIFWHPPPIPEPNADIFLYAQFNQNGYQ